jgi:hypothetical protein
VEPHVSEGNEEEQGQLIDSPIDRYYGGAVDQANTEIRTA